MVWAKVDDGWWSHPKVLALSLEARGLWITTLSWSCQQRRPNVPDALVRMVGGEAVATELVDAGLWHRNGSGYTIHDWEDYQERSLSEKRAEAGAAGGRASAEARREATEANAKQTEVAARSTDEAKAEAGPSRPCPTQPNPTKSENPRAARDAPTPERVAELWNEHRGPLPRVTGLPPKRRQHLSARLRAPGRDEAWWIGYFQRIASTPFLLGEKGWRADFDFAIRSEDVVTRVIEGTYDDDGKRPGNGTRNDTSERALKLAEELEDAEQRSREDPRTAGRVLSAGELA